MFAIQMFVNVGMVIGIMPITGIPLPFLSYGGIGDARELHRGRAAAERAHAPLQVATVESDAAGPPTTPQERRAARARSLRGYVAVHRAGATSSRARGRARRPGASGCCRSSACSSGSKIRSARLGVDAGPVVDHADLGDVRRRARPGPRTSVLGREGRARSRRAPRGSGARPVRLRVAIAGGRAPRRGRGRRPRRPRGRPAATSAHSVRPASTAASKRCDEPGEVARRERRACRARSSRCSSGGAARRSDCAMPRITVTGVRSSWPSRAISSLAAGGALQQRLLGDLELPGAAPLALERLGQLLDDGRRHLGGEQAAARRRLRGSRGGSRRRRSP